MSQTAQLHDRQSDEDAVSILQTAKVFCCRDEEGRSVPFAKKSVVFHPDGVLHVTDYPQWFGTSFVASRLKCACSEPKALDPLTI